MYGLVNQAVRDLIVSRFGQEKWATICRRSGVNDDEFEAMKAYPDHLTYALVGSAAEVLGADAGDLLKAFGEYWITFTAQEGYGEMLDLFGSDLITCLKNLNGMHAHMGVMMPELQPPRFQIEEMGDKRYQLRYFSKRAGLAPMVMGLLEGLAKKHGNTVKVQQMPRDPAQDHELFLIEIVS
ncbi:MAG: hypothetical protein RJB38_616 [Pseudomonadota bacterium]|jgi:hypothetical protein